MSLINRMLQDLESRRATLSNDAGLSQEIRSLPPQRTVFPWAGLLIGATVVALLLGGAAWWFFGRMTVEEDLKPASAAISPAPVAVATAPMPAPPTVEVAPAPPPPEAVAKGNPTEGSPKTHGTVSPQPTAVAKPPATPAVQSKAETARAPSVPGTQASPALPKGLADRGTGLKVETTLAHVPPGEATAAADDSRIEKKMRTSTTRERAENEYRRALGLVNQGRVQDGMAVLRGALSEDAGHMGARLALFGLLVEQQRHEEARALLQEALARDPAQPQLASRLARLQLEGGDVRGAEQTLNKAAGAAAGNAEFRAFHAAVLQRLTLHKEAVTEYQAALRLVPQAGIWWMGMGISLEADGRLAEAREAYQRAKATGALSAELTAFVDQKLRQLQ